MILEFSRENLRKRPRKIWSRRLESLIRFWIYKNQWYTIEYQRDCTIRSNIQGIVPYDLISKGLYKSILQSIIYIYQFCFIKDGNGYVSTSELKYVLHRYQFMVYVKRTNLHWTLSCPRTTGVHLITRAGSTFAVLFGLSLSLTLSHSLLLSLTFSYSLSFSLTLSHSLKRHLLEKNGTWKFCAEVLRISLNYVYYSAPQKNRKIGDQTQRIFQEFQGINISY